MSLWPEPYQDQFLRGEAGNVGGEGFGHHLSAKMGKGPGALTESREIFDQALGAAHTSGSLSYFRGHQLASPQ